MATKPKALGPKILARGRTLSAAHAPKPQTATCMLSIPLANFSHSFLAFGSTSRENAVAQNKQIVEMTSSRVGYRYSSRSRGGLYPRLGNKMLEQGRTDGSGDVRSSLAPVEARAAEHAVSTTFLTIFTDDDADIDEEASSPMRSVRRHPSKRSCHRALPLRRRFRPPPVPRDGRSRYGPAAWPDLRARFECGRGDLRVSWPPPPSFLRPFARSPPLPIGGSDADPAAPSRAFLHRPIEKDGCSPFAALRQQQRQVQSR